MNVYIVWDYDGTVGVRETYEDARKLAENYIQFKDNVELDIEVWGTEDEAFGYAEVERRYAEGVWHRFVDGKGWRPEGEAK